MVRREYWIVGRPKEKPTRSPALTPRERQIVAAMMTAASNRDIARRLGLSEQSVKNRLTSLYRRLGIRNRVELVLLLMKTGE